MTNKYSNTTNKLLIALLFTVFGLSSCYMDLSPLPPTIDQELDKAIQRGFDGIIVYVNQAGTSSFYSSGWNNRADQTEADPHCLFKIASISKLYIAAAATQLVAREQLKLESTLLELIPEVEGRIENADKITLKMMLKHRSGIPEYIYEPDFESDTDEDYLTTASLIFDKPADFAPDKKRSYSNTNYLLIGEILDRAIGYSHHEFIHDEILMPLELTNTYSLYSEVDSNQVMSGYLKKWDPDLKSWDHTQPGGSMVASAEDVGIFLRSLFDVTLFNDDEQLIYSSVYEYEHTGWLPGYTSIARYHSEVDAVVVQFVNTSSNSWFWIDLEKVYRRIVKIVKKNT